MQAYDHVVQLLQRVARGESVALQHSDMKKNITLTQQIAVYCMCEYVIGKRPHCACRVKHSCVLVCEVFLDR